MPRTSRHEGTSASSEPISRKRTNEDEASAEDSFPLRRKLGRATDYKDSPGPSSDIPWRNPGGLPISLTDASQTSAYFPHQGVECSAKTVPPSDPPDLSQTDVISGPLTEWEQAQIPTLMEILHSSGSAPDLITVHEDISDTGKITVAHQALEHWCRGTFSSPHFPLKRAMIAVGGFLNTCHERASEKGSEVKVTEDQIDCWTNLINKQFRSDAEIDAIQNISSQVLVQRTEKERAASDSIFSLSGDELKGWPKRLRGLRKDLNRVINAPPYLPLELSYSVERHKEGLDFIGKHKPSFGDDIKTVKTAIDSVVVQQKGKGDGKI
ncbi:hypothetical protein I302_100049 [Kwoniella bestiolae CBS 10118]|uniref:Uncharacterized protein n=1 Tax=Kwoniella bestiolae CBS 10118 TaxID=1296100 RepID=A0A1B9G428_9TREE|nr:hypothetical protein I302_03421 [Kwoniella bestiolae CBS 10118]OCF25748.1 hypothetical protein I302_03421 [Kwoniella bestiolae CBS 10118]